MADFRRLSAFIAFASACIAIASVSHANFRDTRRYNHAILQCEMPIRISGSHRWSGREITVTLNGQTAKTKTDGGGDFAVEFPAMPAGGPYKITFDDGKSKQVAEDVYIGEVWLCIGQSNMTFPMTKLHSKETWQPAKGDSYPLIRKSGRNGWGQATDIDQIKNWPGTPYFFARALHKELDRPIGLVVVGQGGTSLWQWTPSELHETPELKHLYEVMKQRNEIAHEAKKAKKKLPRFDAYPRAKGFSSYRYPWFPMTFGQKNLVNIENWAPKYAARGIVFWQGENDLGISANYEPLFRGMLRRWRENATRDYPLIFIQLPTYSEGPGRQTRMAGIAGLRDAQRRVADSEPHTQMVVTYDIYGRGIHPHAKREYGERLAQTVLGMVYEKDVPWRSPEFDAVTFDDGKAVVKFKHVGKGLRARGGGKTIKGFTLSGKDGQFHPATATVTAVDTVVVTSDQVSAPVAVRYAWARNPVADLVGDGKLPVSPFRSDDWELYPHPADIDK